MTGYTVHTGSTEKFSEGFDRIFAQGAGMSAGKKVAKPATKKATTKSAGKQGGGKKAAGKKSAAKKSAKK